MIQDNGYLKRFRDCSTIFAVCAALCLSILLSGSVALADGWPTYRFDNARGGVSSEKVTPPLSLSWVYESLHAPSPAWPLPAEEMPRTNKDNVFHATIGGGLVFFGSSVDDQVFAVDKKKGEVRWTFTAGGAVRFAPTYYEKSGLFGIDDERLYFGDDDGYVYCLKAASGKLIWKYRPGPSGEKLLGNGRMVSLWPIRTSVLVDENEEGVLTAFFAAGVFPYEGLYISAVNADTGEEIWQNDTIGDRAHDLKFGGMSPQGYLVASKTTLYVPSGRAMPAAFNRKNGEFIYWTAPSGKQGGSWTLLDAQEGLVAGVDRSGTPAKVAVDPETGKKRGDVYGWFPGVDMVTTPKTVFTLTRDGIYSIDRAQYKDVKKRSAALLNTRDSINKRKENFEALLKNPKADEASKSDAREQIKFITKRMADLTSEDRLLKKTVYRWHYKAQGLDALILAGDVVFAGGQDRVVAIDAAQGAEIWSRKVTGEAYGLAASDGDLVVSTDAGNVYCFTEGIQGQGKEILPKVVADPFADKMMALYGPYAETVLDEAAEHRGWCLVLNCGEGRLAYEIARQTQFKVIGLEKDPKRLAKARKNLSAAGLLGSRVVVESWDLSTLPDYFANLVVSDSMFLTGKMQYDAEEIFRVLKPSGGIAFFQAPPPGMRKTGSPDLDHLSRWVKNAASTVGLEILREGGARLTVRRAALPGAGSWTQLYANDANTACSDDQLAKGPFGVLWFGEPGPSGMVERHARATSPVAIDGRLFVQGEEEIAAHDSYNGTFLWKRKIPGAVRVRADVDGGNLALTSDGLYVAAHEQCLRLNPATGETMRTYEMPLPKDGKERRWGYISVRDGILYGVAADALKNEYADVWKKIQTRGGWPSYDELMAARGEKNDSPTLRSAWERYGKTYPDAGEDLYKSFQRGGTHWRSISNFPSWGSQSSPKGALTQNLMGGDAIFALDCETGKTIWVHRGKRIPNIAVVFDEERVLFVEETLSAKERQSGLDEKRASVTQGLYEEGSEASLKPQERDVRLVVALNAKTGKTLWKKPLDLTGCGGDKMGTSQAGGLLLFFGCFSNHDTKLFRSDKLAWRRVTAISAETGKLVWSRPLNYLRRPLVIGDTIIVEPRAVDLQTGQARTRVHPVTGLDVPWEFLRPGHCCAVTGASPFALFYRSYCMAIYDYERDSGLSLFGGLRLGCWLNAIPANGLVLIPEASSGCTCSFPIRTTFVLKNKQKADPWKVFISNAASTPIKHLAVNLGAPGDLRDAEGTLWFGYPRPKTVSPIGYPAYAMKLDLKAEFLDTMGYFAADHRGVEIPGTTRPFLFKSGCLGLTRLQIPLGVATAAPYTIRLGFLTQPGDQRGQRVFDIALQGKVVEKDFDLSDPSLGDGGTAIVRTFTNVSADANLTLELIPKAAAPTSAQAPLLHSIEVIRQDR